MLAKSKLKLPVGMENLAKAIEFILDFARQQGFTDEKLTVLKLVSEEILVNIINYAYPEDMGEVEVSCGLEGNDRFIIEFCDTGVAFNPLSKPEPDIHAGLSDRKIGGLGIYLTRKMVDDVTYRYENNKNILTFVILKDKAITRRP